MSEESGSGNRWEPSGDADHQDTQPVAAPPAEQPAEPTHQQPAVAAATTDTRRNLKRTGLVVAAAASVFLIGGVGGFAVGHATADGGRGTDAQRFDPRGPGHLGPGQPGPGQDGGPGFGQRQGPPNGDGDGPRPGDEQDDAGPGSSGESGT